MYITKNGSEYVKLCCNCKRHFPVFDAVHWLISSEHCYISTFWRRLADAVDTLYLVGTLYSVCTACGWTCEEISLSWPKVSKQFDEQFQAPLLRTTRLNPTGDNTDCTTRFLVRVCWWTWASQPLMPPAEYHCFGGGKGCENDACTTFV